MWDTLFILFDDLKRATLDVSTGELVRPIFFGLWLFILFMPLKNIDRRDPIAGLMFTFYCVGAGAALMIALPQHVLPDFEFKTSFIILLSMGTAAFCRWFLSSNFFFEKDS